MVTMLHGLTAYIISPRAVIESNNYNNNNNNNSNNNNNNWK